MIALLVVVSIQIDCHLASLAKFSDDSLEIKREGSGYSDGKRRIEPALVNELVAALEEQAPKLRIEALVPSRAELVKAVERRPEEKRQKLLQRIGDRARVREVVRAHYDDDDHYETYPSCHVSVRGKKRLDADSQSRHAFMLPWRMGRSLSFSARIGRAVAALLPPDFTERETLLGSWLADEVVQALSGK